MTRSIRVFVASLALVTLSGCSVFYPNWGATSLPEEPELTTTQSAEPEPEVEASQTEAEPSESAEPEPTETKKPEPKKATVEIIMAVVEPDFGVLSVIAQLPGITDTGGSCELRFKSGSFEKKVTVKAEPSSDYTQCFPFEVPLKDLTSGTGIVTVSYNSAAYIGTSGASSVVIP